MSDGTKAKSALSKLRRILINRQPDKLSDGIALCDQVYAEVLALRKRVEAADDAIRDAFIDGATAIHIEWTECHERGDAPPRGDPDFAEAASDYVAAYRATATSDDKAGV